MTHPLSFKEKTFNSAYEAGFDCGLHGADNFNTHYRFFSTKKGMQDWETGKRNAQIKEGLIDKEADSPKNRGSQRSPFGIG